jgi:hypothetical protein
MHIVPLYNEKGAMMFNRPSKMNFESKVKYNNS